MAQRRFHYDAAFEYYLQSRQISYVAVDEARRAPGIADPMAHHPPSPSANPTRAGKRPGLKNFDFVVYSRQGANLLVDVKGRKHTGKTTRSFQNWVTQDDIKSMQQWRMIFGKGFEPIFAFLFWCDAQPPDALFHEIFAYHDRWYVLMTIDLDCYLQHLRERSARWKTVHIPAAVFNEHARPLMDLL